MTIISVPDENSGTEPPLSIQPEFSITASEIILQRLDVEPALALGGDGFGYRQDAGKGG